MTPFTTFLFCFVVFLVWPVLLDNALYRKKKIKEIQKIPYLSNISQDNSIFRKTLQFCISLEENRVERVSRGGRKSGEGSQRSVRKGVIKKIIR